MDTLRNEDNDDDDDDDDDNSNNNNNNNTLHSQETRIHAPSGIRTHNPSERASGRRPMR